MTQEGPDLAVQLPPHFGDLGLPSTATVSLGRSIANNASPEGDSWIVVVRKGT